MYTVRLSALLLIVLTLGILLGFLGWKVALTVLVPLIFVWLMNWDEKSYLKQQHEHHYY
ncbi:hypothetical protein [Vagococcus silagei]|uniref:hypothetical protein n=1 Tax=Vagococcus silagei TaxID=2508885 RepID=UPI00194E48EF|nr:hypothetical protein [Vagococcus silagei]